MFNISIYYAAYLCASIDIGHKKYIENFMQLLISIMATKFNHCADKYNNGKLPLKNS